MSETEELKKRLIKRLAPLYVSAFFQSFVLWYTIEKLFMRSIGFNNTAIGFMIAVYSVVMLLVETPSGILADRWSRKGVLILAGICLSLSAVAGSLSHGIGTYLIAAVLWGSFFACYSGMYDSIIYDTVAESTDTSRLFDFLYGRAQLVESISLVLAGLAGALIAEQAGLRATYFWSVPAGLISILALIRFREPTLHKKQAVIPIKQQAAATFQAILKNRSLLPVIIALILRVTLVYTLYEFAQLWLLALRTPTGYYGVANGVLLTSLGLGGVLVYRLRLSRYPLMLCTLLLMLLGCSGLIVFRSTAAIVASQFILASGLISIGVIFNRILHDSLSPSIRAGAASATSTIGRFFIIPLALSFGYVSQKLTVYKASYILLALTTILALFVISVARRNNRKGLEPS